MVRLRRRRRTLLLAAEVLRKACRVDRSAQITEDLLSAFDVDEIAVEESSSHGRLDMAVRTCGYGYPFEFKVAELSPSGSALAQLKERDYAATYRDPGRAHPPDRR